METPTTSEHPPNSREGRQGWAGTPLGYWIPEASNSLQPEGENQPWEGAWGYKKRHRQPGETPSSPLSQRTGWDIKGHRG